MWLQMDALPVVEAASIVFFGYLGPVELVRVNIEDNIDKLKTLYGERA